MVMERRSSVLILLSIFIFGIAGTPALAATNEYIYNYYLKVEQMKYEPFPAEPGQYVKVWLKLKNVGSKQLNNVYLMLEEEYPFSFDPGDNGTKIISSINPSQEILVEYEIRVDSKALEGDYDLNLKYKIGSSGRSIISIPITMSVTTPNPVLDFVTVRYEPERLSPGDIAKIILTMRNNADSDIKDISLALDLSGEDIPFAPLNGISEKTIRALSVGESRDVVFDIIVEGNAVSQVYKIPLDVSYSDAAGNEITRSDNLALVVDEQPDLLYSLEPAEGYFTKGMTGDVVLSISNKGLTKVSFLDVEILDSDQYSLVSNNKVYIGNIDSDDYETAEFKINIGKVKGEIPIRFKINYKDNFNKLHTDYKDINLRIYTSGELSKLGLVQGNYNGVYFLIFIIAIAGGWFYYKKYYKKKK